MIVTILMFIAWFVVGFLVADIVASTMFCGMDRLLKNPEKPRGALYTLAVLVTSVVVLFIAVYSINVKIADVTGLNERMERDFNYSFKIEKKQPDMAKDLGTDMGAD